MLCGVPLPSPCDIGWHCYKPPIPLIVEYYLIGHLSPIKKIIISNKNLVPTGISNMPLRQTGGPVRPTNSEKWWLKKQHFAYFLNIWLEIEDFLTFSAYKPFDILMTLMFFCYINIKYKHVWYLWRLLEPSPQHKSQFILTQVPGINCIRSFRFHQHFTSIYFAC